MTKKELEEDIDQDALLIAKQKWWSRLTTEEQNAVAFDNLIQDIVADESTNDSVKSTLIARAFLNQQFSGSSYIKSEYKLDEIKQKLPDITAHIEKEQKEIDPVNLANESSKEWWSKLSIDEQHMVSCQRLVDSIRADKTLDADVRTILIELAFKTPRLSGRIYQDSKYDKNIAITSLLDNEHLRNANKLDHSLDELSNLEKTQILNDDSKLKRTKEPGEPVTFKHKVPNKGPDIPDQTDIMSSSKKMAYVLSNNIQKNEKLTDEQKQKIISALDSTKLSQNALMELTQKMHELNQALRIEAASVDSYKEKAKNLTNSKITEIVEYAHSTSSKTSSQYVLDDDLLKPSADVELIEIDAPAAPQFPEFVAGKKQFSTTSDIAQESILPEPKQVPLIISSNAPQKQFSTEVIIPSKSNPLTKEELVNQIKGIRNKDIINDDQASSIEDNVSKINDSDNTKLEKVHELLIKLATPIMKVSEQCRRESAERIISDISSVAGGNEPKLSSDLAGAFDEKIAVPIDDQKTPQDTNWNAEIYYEAIRRSAKFKALLINRLEKVGSVGEVEKKTVDDIIETLKTKNISSELHEKLATSLLQKDSHDTPNARLTRMHENLKASSVTVYDLQNEVSMIIPQKSIFIPKEKPKENPKENPKEFVKKIKGYLGL